jgi:hypothetical protein
MNEPTDLVRGYARKTDADFRASELYEGKPEAVASECDELLFLQKVDGNRRARD